MFTGLVQSLGSVAGVHQTAAGLRLLIDPSPPAPPPDSPPISPPVPPSASSSLSASTSSTLDAGRPFELGESIAVNGCCLTLAQLLPPPSPSPQLPNPNSQLPSLLAFDVIPETLAKTTLGSLAPDARVNLERSATPTTLLGGHIVQGHIDGLARVLSISTLPDWRIRFSLPQSAGPATAPADHDLVQYLVPKGSVCVEGVSLTIAALSVPDRWFEVALIPTTLERTTLASLRVGDHVNLELDTLAKTVVHYLRHFLAYSTAHAPPPAPPPAPLPAPLPAPASNS